MSLDLNIYKNLCIRIIATVQISCKLNMAASPDFDEVLATLKKVALAAGEMILRGAENARKSKASGASGSVKEKLNCTCFWENARPIRFRV